MIAALLVDERLDERPGLPLEHCGGCYRPMVRGVRRCGDCFARLNLRGLHPDSAAYYVASRCRRRLRYSELLGLCPDLDKTAFDRALRRLLQTGRLRRPLAGHYEPRSPES